MGVGVHGEGGGCMSVGGYACKYIYTVCMHSVCTSGDNHMPYTCMSHDALSILPWAHLWKSPSCLPAA